MTTRSKAKAKATSAARSHAQSAKPKATAPVPHSTDSDLDQALDDPNGDGHDSTAQQQQSLWSLPSQSQQSQLAQPSPSQLRPAPPHRLEFTHSLVPRAGATKDKAIPASDLVKRLKTLNDALKALPQEATDTESCDQVAQDLVHASVLHHRDRGVKILVACCLSEILRLYAPEAPYDDAQLKDIFDLFANQFQHLSQLENNPYHAFYLQLLASLVAVRSICIVADLDTAEDLTLLFFSHMLTNLQPQHPPHVHKHAADLLITLIAECATIPLEAVELLLDAAVPASSEKDAESESADAPARKLALSVLRDAGHLLHKPVAQSFMDTLLTAAKAVHQRTPSAAQALVQSTQAHARMSALYPVSPKMLLNVIPQLEEELVAEHVPFRELALRTLAAMAQLPSMVAPPLAREYPSAWRAWCGRAVDKVPAVRLLWLALAPGVYNAHAHGEVVAGELNAALVKLLLDPDEKVRGAACSVFGQGRLEFDVVRKSASVAVWDALGSRIRDKRASVRLAAIKAAGYVWRRVMHVVLPSKAVPVATETQAAAAAAAAAAHATADSQRIEPPTQSFQVHHTNLDADEISKLMATFSWCPRDLLGSAYLNDPELTAILENLLIESVVHPKEPGQPGSKNASMGASEWELATDRLLWFLSTILDDDHAKRAFIAVLKRQSVTATETLALLDLARQYAGLEGTQQRGDLQLRINRIIQAMAARLPDAPRAEQALNAFVKAYDPSWGDALTSLSQWSDRDFAQVKRTAKDVLRTMEVAMPGSMQVLGIVARRMAPFIVSHEMVPGLIGRISIAGTGREAEDEGGDEGGWAVRLRATAMWVLDVLAREFPLVVAKYAGHVLQVLDSVPDRAAVLNALARVECKDLTARQMERLKVMAEDNPSFAPAIGAVLARGNHVAACEDLVMYAADQIINQDTNAEAAAGALGMLAKIVKHQVHTYEDMPQGVDRVTARTVWWLMREYSAVDSSALDARTWVEPADRPAETRAQVAAVKLLTNRVVALGNGASTHDLARQALVPLVSLLDKVLATRGSLDLGDLPEFAASALRLVAGRAVLKLARTPAVADRIPEHLYLHTAMLIEDPVQQVRAQMLAKVRGLLALMLVSARWVPLVALAANDPDDLTKQSAGALLKGMAHNPTLARGVELALPRLVHVVAHLVRPGAVVESVSASATAATAAAAIKAVAGPIELYLDAVMRAESVATLFHVLVKIKEHKAKHPVALHTLTPAGSDDVGKANLISADQLARGINTNAYALAEYATKYLRDRCKLHGWPIATVPKAIDLPRDLYVALDRAEAVANTKRTYLAPTVTASALAASSAGTVASAGARKSAAKRTRKQAGGGEDEGGDDEVDVHGESGSDRGSAPVTPAKSKAKRVVRPTGKASASKRRKTSKSHDDDDEGEGDVEDEQAASPMERRKSGRVQQQKQRKSYHEPGSEVDEDEQDPMDVDEEEQASRRSPAAKKAKKAAKSSPNGRKARGKAASQESGSDTE